MDNAFNIPILYEDSDVVVVNKPAGLVVHSDGKTEEPTLVDWLLEKYPDIRGVGDRSNVNGQKSNVLSAERSGIVHRLDRDTSGVLVVAKTQAAFLFLKKQFQARQTEKTYRAFVYGEVKKDEGVINRPIARSASDFRQWSATRGAKGKEREAVTEYRVLGRMPAAARRGGGGDSGFSFLDVRPKTGRTHQIRVHLKAVNHPVVCDKLYAPNRPCALGFKRLALHALSLGFILPCGRQFLAEAPYPKDFEEAMKVFKSEAQNPCLPKPLRRRQAKS